MSFCLNFQFIPEKEGRIHRHNVGRPNPNPKLLNADKCMNGREFRILFQCCRHERKYELPAVHASVNTRKFWLEALASHFSFVTFFLHKRKQNKAKETKIGKKIPLSLLLVKKSPVKEKKLSFFIKQLVATFIVPSASQSNNPSFGPLEVILFPLYFTESFFIHISFFYCILPEFAMFAEW